MPRRFTVNIVTDSSQAFTGYIQERVSGKVHMIKFANGSGDDAMADTTDITVTADATGETIWSRTDSVAAATVYPRAQVHLTDGTALTYDGTYKVCEPIVLYNDLVKVVVAQGGASKSGTLTVVIDN